MKLKWDSFSDQPKVIKDKAFKRQIKKEASWASFKMKISSLLLFPISYLLYLLVPAKKLKVLNSHYFGISINLDKNPDNTRQLIDDLGVNNLLIRLPLHDIENLQSYVDFAEQYKDKSLLINILQDRRHVEDLQRLEQSLELIFQHFAHLTNRFQIGNAINRKKWAIFSIDEYLDFYKVAYDLKKSKFPNLVLLGSSVIDFEYYFTIRTLFNFYKVHYDQFSSLLYVDRRGAPENTQMGLDLIKKLHLLHTLLRFSSKSSTDIIISETNWPIENTAPYAPTSEKECVSLDDHANYLVRYYLLALASGVVKQVYWHQLIAPGYGLIDNRGEILVKYPAYYAFKTMLSLLQDTEFTGLRIDGTLYCASFRSHSRPEKIDVYWALTSCKISPENSKIVLRDGQYKKSSEAIELTESPLYVISSSSETEQKKKA